MDRWMRRAAIALAISILPVIFVYTRVGETGQNWMYRGIGLVGSLAIVAGVRIHRPRRALAWYLLAAGNLMWVAGDLIYSLSQNSAGVSPFPGYNDILYVAAYPVLAAGLIALSGGSRQSLGSFIDACIIATSAGLLAWVFLMEPYMTDPSLTMGERLVSIAYPVGDLLLLATVCWFFFSQRRANASLSWLLVSTTAVLISDSVAGYQLLQGTYAAGLTDAGYFISYLAFGIAALHPSMKTIGGTSAPALATISRRRLGLLAVASILGPALVATEALHEPHTNLWLLIVGTLVLFLLTFMRMVGLVRLGERTAALLGIQGRDLATANTELLNLQVVRSHLSDALHHTVERERSSLAVDLHDGPIQHLTTLSFEVDLATISLATGARADAVDALQALEAGLATEVENLRHLMTDLRPPVLDERGLSEALRDLVTAFTARTGIECELDLDIDRRASRQIETVLYRIAQEALVNVGKHAEAKHAVVRCRFDQDQSEMEISDDGIGFDVAATDMSGMDGHLGLASIRERIEFAGGTLVIDPTIGQGTRVKLTLPLGERADEQVAGITS